ncbi:hypothetical protein MCOR27_008396 [Pyricularia oryzae]|uniref:Cytochrome P450 n=2 Tax=Pyricularia TaxID=48558 RepID=A0ABQ8NA65_PYRGI|nr:hypothetical protein MCOR01_009976 [Pyricularia oryzae]KAI6293803.1 hypothetical protein MCOR33_008875 [Pyricularia grisea]KAI6258976.1 hypothetical protein MCOR19_004630 [Pyricularia oryzae]KAI6272331.1 hypothetical protein MCOR27_008396 [Pyricularia oryzae]KAI6272352.1 hypothetical protein MCOR26_007395 [Pyricularia oryzae]
MASNGAGVFYSSAFFQIRDLGAAEIVRRIALFSAYSFSLFLVFFTIRAIYNIWFHPLSKYPGPWYAATTNLVYYIADITGYRERWILRQHQKYGEVVRTGPIRLSYTSASAWKDIVGHRSAGKLEMLKDPWLYDAGQAFGADGVSMISNVDSETHGKMRKIFTNAFSDRALREQEPLLLKYVDKLIRRIHTDLSGDPNRPLDLVLLLNCTTFDIMADLTFGESLGMLDNGKYTPWVARIFDTIKYAAIFGIAGRWVWLRNLVRATLPASMRKSLEEHRGYVNERVERRMAKDTDQPDIWNLVLRNPENVKLLGRGSMNEHANLFMVAGTETTATLLSGLTYFLLKKPSTYEKIVAEVRSLPEDGLHIDSLRQLPYLQACFEEALRMYPPVPMGMPRVVPPGGAAISGGFVPEGTRVAVHQLSCYRNEKNFKNAFEFIPERWLPEYADEYGSDRKEALQPFSYGPRNCMGKNLAYHEMRLIFAKLLWNFDIELCPESDNWTDQRIFTLWEKHPLMVKFKPRKV